MRQKSKLIFISIFVLATIYTFYGILQLAREGGPCNGGLALIVLAPFLLISIGLIIATFILLNRQNKLDLTIPIILTRISLLAWTLGSSTFLSDSLKETVQYLGLFELFHICLFIYLIRQYRLNKVDNTD
jgi:hypothetical protein